MSVVFRGLLVLALVWMAYACLHQANLEQKKEDPNTSRVVTLFGGVVAAGLGGGLLVVTYLLPKLGESVGNAFFNPSEQGSEHPHAKALSATAQGNYAKAVEEYKKIAEHDPEDTLALSEAARILCDKMHECDAAAALLENSLDSEWPPEDAAFLSLRLADVYWGHQHDAVRARELLLQVMQTLPDTKHANNAAHKLHEIDRKLMLEG